VVLEVWTEWVMGFDGIMMRGRGRVRGSPGEWVRGREGEGDTLQ